MVLFTSRRFFSEEYRQLLATWSSTSKMILSINVNSYTKYKDLKRGRTASLHNPLNQY
jgi:hypothetical protein